MTMYDARRAAGVRRCDIAAKLGVSPWTVRNWEDNVTTPTVKHFFAYCEAVNVSPSDVELPILFAGPNQDIRRRIWMTGLRKKDIAEEMGISQSTFSRYIMGEMPEKIKKAMNKAIDRIAQRKLDTLTAAREANEEIRYE